MYNPPAFREHDADALHRFIRERHFGLLVSCSAEGPLATALPLLLDASVPPLGVLTGHLSRGNPHALALDGAEVLVVFQGLTPTCRRPGIHRRSSTGRWCRRGTT